MTVQQSVRGLPHHIRQALWARDKRCRYPGCRRTHQVGPHHIRRERLGSDTNLGDLVLLCEPHHKQVQDAGYRICVHERTLAFIQPGGNSEAHEVGMYAGSRFVVDQ